ncbi:MAG: thioesterase family protein [Pseudomonadota bacterium]
MLTLHRTCLPEWVDFNNHMRDAYYVLVISFANDQTMDELGMGPRYLNATGRTLYNLDTRIKYLKEAHGGDELTVEMLLIDADQKRLHLHSTIRNRSSGIALAVNESVLLHVNQNKDSIGGPKSEAFPENVRSLVEQRFKRDSAFEPHLRVGDIGWGR